MTVGMITYCECKKEIVSCGIKQTIKLILSRMLISYIAKRQRPQTFWNIWSIKSYSRKLFAQGPDYRSLII